MAFRLISMACLLLATVPGLASAQTAQNEQLKQVVSNLRACVRTHAPTAQAAGIKTTGEAVEFFRKMCNPPLTLGENADLGENDVRAIPPGTFRIAIIEEWTTLIEEARPR